MLSLEELYHGRTTAACALVVNGRCEVRDCVEQLPASAQRRILAVMQRLADYGLIADPHLFRRLDTGIYELKEHSMSYRVFCFQSGRDWVFTHGAKKPGKRELRQHIDKVKALRVRFTER
jgi:phage-related protein